MNPDSRIHAAMLTGSISRTGGGVSEVVRRLSQSLAAHGSTIEVMGFDDEHTETDRKLWDPIKPWTCRRVGPRSFGYAPALWAHLKGCDASLIHLHGLWMYSSWACHTWSKSKGKPHIVTSYGMLEQWAVRRSRLKKAVALLLYEHANLRSAGCIHVSAENETRNVRSFGLRNPLCVIPSGVDLPPEGGGTLEDIPSFMRDLMAGGRKVLLYLGRIHPKKGLANLLTAWAELKRKGALQFDAWALVIAGWDQDGHEAVLVRQARELDLMGTVMFVGPQFGGAKAACFRHACGFVLPSFSEGLPMAALEAWAYNLPVVMTPECNLPEGFAAEAALSVRPEAEDIVRGLADLLTMTDAQRRAMGARGRALVEQRFNWDAVALQMQAVYQWVVGGGARPACVRMD